MVDVSSTTISRAPATTAKPASAQGSDGKQLAVGDWAYFDGEIVPFANATVSVATHALNYGTAIFEGIRAYRQADGGLALLFALEHYQRLLRNGRLLRASVNETAPDLVEITCELLRRNAVLADLYVRPLLYKSAQSIRLQLTGLDDRITIFSFPLGDYVPTAGLNVALSAWQRVNDNAVPARGKITGSYVNACLAVEDAKAGGYGEALLLNVDGHVAEASAANLFVVQDDVIATPPVADDVLPGVTRMAVLKLAEDTGRRGRDPQDRPNRAVHLRRGLSDGHGSSDRGSGHDRRPARRRSKAWISRDDRPAAGVLRRGSRHGPALRVLADSRRQDLSAPPRSPTRARAARSARTPRWPTSRGATSSPCPRSGTCSRRSPTALPMGESCPSRTWARAPCARSTT